MQRRVWQCLRASRLLRSLRNVFIGDLPAYITLQDCEAIFQGYGTVVQCKVMEPKNEGQKSSALVRFANVEEAQWVVENLNGNIAEGLEEPVVARFANPPGSKWEKGGSKGTGAGAWNAGCWQQSARAEPYGGKGVKGSSWAGSGAAPGAWAGSGKGAGKAPPPGSFRALYDAVKKGGLLGGGLVPNECQIYAKNLPADTTDLDLYKLFAPFGAVAPSGTKAMLNEDGTCKGFGFVDYVDPISAQAAIEALNGFAMPDGSTISVATKTPSAKDGKGGKGKGKELV